MQHWNRCKRQVWIDCHWPLNMSISKLYMRYKRSFALHMFEVKWHVWDFPAQILWISCQLSNVFNRIQTKVKLKCQPLLFLDCADEEFLCPTEQKCISRSVVCDYYPDCTDLADEFGCGGEFISDYLILRKTLTRRGSEDAHCAFTTQCRKITREFTLSRYALSSR